MKVTLTHQVNLEIERLLTSFRFVAKLEVQIFEARRSIRQQMAATAIHPGLYALPLRATIAERIAHKYTMAA
jgi:hypothetical protein